MRELKFRAISKDKEWVYGFFVVGEENAFIYAENKKYYTVDESTVGQFTGLQDKNGVDIYEGDVLRFKDKLEWYWSPFLSANEINEILNNHEKYPYEQRLVELPESYEWLLSSEIQSFWAVIGNIHENQELLETNNDL